MSSVVHIVGGGLAGSEAAYQLAKRNIKVVLHEMRPIKMTPVHKTGLLAELVCSNSLKSDDIENASGLLKRELELLGSMLIKVARQTAVPAGKALAVDREKFSQLVTQEVLNAGVEIVREEICEIPDDKNIWIIATGPATSEALALWLEKVVGDHLYFFDAVAPIVSADSIDYSKVFFADRYGVGTNDHINCPMNKEEYERFYEALVNAEVQPMEGFDTSLLFERCKPIEEIARTGKEALLFGPLRPVGIIDPRTGKQPYAVVQLRKDNMEGTLYNLVGFQTRLKWGEQKKVIRMIPGLENAEIVRYGVMHRNLYIDSPRVLNQFLQLKKDGRIFFAGQITGVEGYVESIATGLYVSLNVFRLMNGMEMVQLPRDTLIGSLINYVTQSKLGRLQPMYANYGLLNLSKRDRKEIAKLCLESLETFLNTVNWV
ncbi:methylenetetrahydrofolate--tRNA-(uracil(54)-C(5))-methyltransferase (FADH(2)-oxidizing) TrmFO [Pseudothermotoga thermarum]|uniref:Methylenetetrahydrofolate--tRNA-(uracil-5-)-methyltransferase TrmFO n=1 Tax=Pseudothermotoga thermarum DSM 5069 TaxID=688269 RepID=F7YX75_9THEM|nr:methylenetetrahydrofolate--tRNA-(uracil(54)-C(5))-methyltransferase (FADH(2)-oxidizing) TrmFO [Pseudothermotoga thermarum]AEH51137.1 gid protein [Pseudothermotoga thermarum DSM 5069]